MIRKFFIVFLSFATTFAVLSCGSANKDKQFVLLESEIFLELNLAINDSAQFLENCYFPIAFDEGWIESWEDSKEKIISGAINPISQLKFIERLDLTHRQCGGETLDPVNYAKLRGAIALNQSLTTDS